MGRLSAIKVQLELELCLGSTYDVDTRPLYIHESTRTCPFPRMYHHGHTVVYKWELVVVSLWASWGVYSIVRL